VRAVVEMEACHGLVLRAVELVSGKFLEYPDPKNAHSCAESQGHQKCDANEQEGAKNDPNDVVLRPGISDIDVRDTVLLGLSPCQQIQQLARHDPMLSLGVRLVKPF